MLLIPRGLRSIPDIDRSIRGSHPVAEGACTPSAEFSPEFVCPVSCIDSLDSKSSLSLRAIQHFRPIVLKGVRNWMLDPKVAWYQICI